MVDEQKMFKKMFYTSLVAVSASLVSLVIVIYGLLKKPVPGLLYVLAVFLFVVAFFLWGSSLVDYRKLKKEK